MTDILPCQPVSSEPPVPFIDLVPQYEAMQDEVLAAVKRVLSKQTFILGDEVTEFEAQAATYCDAREAIGCASGTDALVLAMMALDIGPGDEVITTPFTFFATASSIHRVGAKAVFVDIDPVTYNLDPALVEAAITPKTRAIMPVHLYGQCADMEPLWRIATKHGLAIIEDACQAIGAEYRGRKTGVLGTVGCFSFFPTKNLGGAGDGGLLTTDDRELANRLRRLRVHGQTAMYRHAEVGLNSRLDALQAAILKVKLPHLDSWAAARNKIAARYTELYRQHKLLDLIEAPVIADDCRHVFNQYCVRVKQGRRDELQAGLKKLQIGSNVYYPIPLHVQECFAYLGYSQGDFPVTEQASQEVLALPSFPELRDDQQQQIVRGIAKVLGRASQSSTTGKTLKKAA